MKTSIRYDVKVYGDEYAVYSIVETSLGGSAANFVCKGSLEYCNGMAERMYEFTKGKAG